MASCRSTRLPSGFLLSFMWKTLQPRQADKAVEFLHRLLVFRFGASGIARGEDVTCIETDAEPFRLLHAVENGRQMLEAPAETLALAGGGFEQNLDLATAVSDVDLIDCRDDPRCKPASSSPSVGVPGCMTR